jgi:hypothetical protein
VVRLCNPGCGLFGAISLDLYGAELLAGFLMSARLAAIGELSDERCNGNYPLRLRHYATGGNVRIELEQFGERLILARNLWDRLYAELQLMLAHGRHLAGAGPASGPTLREAGRLLH